MKTTDFQTRSTARFAPTITDSGAVLQRIGRRIVFLGVLLPLLLIGGLKFTQMEIDALRPLIGGTPWLAWMYPVFGEAGASYILGTIELATAALLVASSWSIRAAIVAGILASLTFLVTCSTMIALPIWEPRLGFPAIAPLGQFLIKDAALLGISIVVLGEGLAAIKAKSLKALP